MQLLLENKSSQKIMLFRELSKSLTKEKIEGWGFVWRNKKEEVIFFKVTNDLMGEYIEGSKDEYISVNYDLFWKFFEYRFNMTYDEVESFLRERLELDKRMKVDLVFRAYVTNDFMNKFIKMIL